MKRIKHTQDSLKMLEFLQKYAGEWHSLADDRRTKNALDRLQTLLGPEIIEFDGFTNQMRFNEGGYR